MWKRRNAPTLKGTDLTAFIDETSEIDGKYTFTGTVMVNGKFHGEIVSNDTLIIGEKGAVHATIQAGVVVVNGEIVGNVVAKERIELRGTARVFGDMEAPVVLIEEGVLFEGHCRMAKARPAPRDLTVLSETG